MDGRLIVASLLEVLLLAAALCPSSISSVSPASAPSQMLQQATGVSCDDEPSTGTVFLEVIQHSATIRCAKMQFSKKHHVVLYYYLKLKLVTSPGAEKYFKFCWSLTPQAHLK